MDFDIVFGKSVSGVLSMPDVDTTSQKIPWIDEIQYETLVAGTFQIGGSPTKFYESAFFSQKEQVSDRH